MKGRTVENQYRRVTDIDEKIKNISLPYFHWKVLFLVLEETNIDELVKTLNSDEKTVQEALDSLEQNGVLEAAEAATETSDVTPDEVIEESKEEVELIEEMIEESEEEQEEVAAEIISETEEEIEETKTEELEEPIAELLDEIVEEPKEESELLVEEDTEQQPEEAEIEPDQILEDSIEEEFKIESLEEKEEEAEETAPEEVTLDTLEDTLEETETSEIETKEDDESTDISSFIDDIGGEEELGAPQEESVVEKEVKKEPVAKEKSSANAKTVMVIDDSIVIRKMVEIALEDGDYNIVTSNSGKDGLNLLDEENPDLVIVDMTLPDMNGIDLLKTVKASKGIPVIMLSGKDAPQLVESAKSAGADDFLPKPFRDDDLIEKVKNLIK